MEFVLESPSFADRGTIPVRHTCDGEDVSPPLTWKGIPAGTVSFALVVDDPDAPDPAAPRMVWVHWVAWNLPPELEALPEGASGSLPAPAVEGRNDFHTEGWRGPCPPIGTHRYYHKLYALDRMLEPTGPITKPDLERMMIGHVLAKAELVGVYRRFDQPG
jgi:Raf kinase inhibitor-like YbhB/YbcL family protein